MNLSTLFGAKQKPKIFICYRRSGEGAGFGGRIADKLVKHFGHHQCFRDIENIEKGTDFVKSIQYATSICELLLVVIGPDWITLMDENGTPKLQDKNDFVRLEVGTALIRDIRVIPVLVGGAKIPLEKTLPDDLKSLVRRQSHELADSRWEYDSDQLIKSIEAMGIRGRSPKRLEVRKGQQKILVTAVITVLAMLLLVGVRYVRLGPKPTPATQESNSEQVVPAIQPAATIVVDDKSKNNSTQTSRTPAATKINYNREKGSIKNAIILGSSLEAEALLTLNMAALPQVFTGDALRNYKATFSQYRNMGVFDINILESQSFGNFNIYTEGNALLAEVELFETWSGHTHRSSDRRCLLHRASNKAPQTVFLEKKNDSWYITSISHHSTTLPSTTQCGKYNCHPSG